jgi:hypothetical protein
MVRRAENDRTNQRTQYQGLTGWQLVTALIGALVIVGAVIIATLLITDSPAAVTVVTIPLVTVIGWWLRRHLRDAPGE